MSDFIFVSGRRSCAVAVLLAATLTLAACGRGGQKHEAAASAPASPAPAAAATAPPPAAAPQSDHDADIAMLKAGIQDYIAYLPVSVDPQGRYCEPLNPQDATTLEIHPSGNQTAAPFIDRIATNVRLHDVVMSVVRPTYLSQSTGLISAGTCYAVDPSLVQHYGTPGVGIKVPIGRITVSNVAFVNEYQTVAMGSLTQARSYHVDLFVGGRIPDSKFVGNISMVNRRYTCILVHNNAENTWAFQGCQVSG